MTVSLRPDQKVALVTGAARRIGRAIATSLAGDGWAVAIHYNTADDDAAAVVADLVTAGHTAFAVQADLADEAQAGGLIPTVRDHGGTLDLLINNAAHFQRDTFDNLDRATWDAHIATNLRAPVVLTQKFATGRPAATVGAATVGNVINLLDQWVWNPPADFVSYTVAKSALWVATRTAAKALAPGVRVNAIGPGPTLPSQRQSPDHFDNMVAGTPLGRATTLREICDAVRFIIATPSLTGQMIALDGGQHLAREAR